MTGLQFQGLGFEILGWLGAAALLFITIFYVLKLRKRSVEIPFSPLWNRVLSSKKHRTDWWRRLKRIFSWLLHLLIAGLLIFAMAGPHLDEEIIEGRHLLILLDNSASMSANDVTGAHDRYELGTRKAQEILDTVGPNDRVMVALFSNRVQPLGPFVNDTSLVQSSLRDRQPTANPTDLTQALLFAADSLRDRERAELVIISDGSGLDSENPIELSLPDDALIRHILIGESSENLAITAFNARRYPSNRLDHEIFVEVTSYFDRSVRARLEIRSDGRLVDEVPIELGPRAVYRQFYPGQAITGERLEARIRLLTEDARDVFPLDDRAFATVPPPRRLNVQLVSTGNLFIEGPLILNPHIEMERVRPEDYDPTREFDVTVFDRVAPEPPQRGDLLYFDPPAQGSPFTISGREEDPIITDTVQSHPLLRWITLQDLNIGASSTFTRASGDVAVASSFGRAILVARDQEDRRIVALGFDVRNSDFPLRVGFPVFILNILDYFARDDVDLMYSFETGQTFSVPIDRQTRRAEVQTPQGEVIPAAIHDGRALFYGETPGFYVLRTDLAQITLAANLANPEESDIAPRLIEIEGAEVSTDVDSLFFDRQKIWIFVLLLVFALMLVEWFTFNRRITV